jgi:hypothetical protein
MCFDDAFLSKEIFICHLDYTFCMWKWQQISNFVPPAKKKTQIVHPPTLAL